MRRAAGLLIIFLLATALPASAIDLDTVRIVIDGEGNALMKVSFSINPLETSAVVTNYHNIRQTVEDRFSEAIGKEAETECISPTSVVYSIDHFADVSGATYSTPGMNFEKSLATAGTAYALASAGNAEPDTVIVYPDNTTVFYPDAGAIPAQDYTLQPGGETRPPPDVDSTMQCTTAADLIEFKKPFAAVAVGIAVAAIAGNMAAAASATASESLLMGKIVAFFQKLFGNIATGRLSIEDVKRRRIAAVQRNEIVFGFSAIEILAGVIGAAIFGVAFMVAKGKLFDADTFAIFFIVSGIGVAVHEMAHRYVAARYQGISEFKFWDLGSVIMLATGGLFGLVFAKPYRTVISNSAALDKKALGIIMLAGPIISVVLALAFLALIPLGGLPATVGEAGFSVNLLSAVYGMMPFIPMDGDKVRKWSLWAWLAVFVPVLVFYFLILFK
ncbi:MAG TPA: hypothetical protein PLO06_03900 [Methanoregulaceae archaeon]|nr:hypothetical protein [Methanoregulaceae archaeon]HPD76014.1 hypothetical protein [Methanoregulaceae archaeon]